MDVTEERAWSEGASFPVDSLVMVEGLKGAVESVVKEYFSSERVVEDRLYGLETKIQTEVKKEIEKKEETKVMGPVVQGIEGTTNTFYGLYAGWNILNAGGTGSLDTFIGKSAGQSNTTGSYNTFLGDFAGYFNTTGARNVLLGYSAGYNEKGSNKLYIANSDTSTPLIYGDFSAAQVKIHGLLVAASASPSDERLKKEIKPLNGSLDTVARLKGVSYQWRTEDYPGHGFREGTQLGLIAQEVEKVLPEVVVHGPDGYKAVDYQKLVPVLIEAVKEQQGQIERQLALAQSQQAQIEDLKAMIQELRAGVR